MGTLDGWFAITDGEFDHYLRGIVSRMHPQEILDMPGVYEIVSEELNNEVLDLWEKERELEIETESWANEE